MSKSKNKKNNKKKKSFFTDVKRSYSYKETLYIMIFSLLLGIVFCFSILFFVTGGKNFIKMSWELDKFYQVYKTIYKNYLDVDKDKLIEGAINGMVDIVPDDYADYASSDSTSSFTEMVSGVYEGIGCSISLIDNHIVIVSVYEDSPSEKAGLKSGDIIVSVDSKDALEMGTTKLSNYIKNKDDSNVSMVIDRDNEEIEVTIKRDKVEIPVVFDKVIENNGKKIGYISLTIFSNVSSSQFKKKLLRLEEDKIDGLVIDVRSNSGGSLTSVTDILNMFNVKGSILYQISNGKDKEIIKDTTKEKRSYPIAVLINGSSASASEILASSIKESYNGYVVGTKSFGKGTVQEVKTLSDGSIIKYTIENWLSPKGNVINNVGVEPTHIVELSEEYLNDMKEENDNQLVTAIELVSK